MFLNAFAKFLKANISFIMSVCLSNSPSAWNNSAITGLIFIKFDFIPFFENVSRTFLSHYNHTKITGPLRDIYYNIRWIILEWDISDKVVEKIKTYILLYIYIFENHAVYEIKWKNMEQPVSLHICNIIRRMRLAYWITKATDTHSDYSILCTFSLALRISWSSCSHISRMKYKLLFLKVHKYFRCFLNRKTGFFYET